MLVIISWKIHGITLFKECRVNVKIFLCTSAEEALPLEQKVWRAEERIRWHAAQPARTVTWTYCGKCYFDDNRINLLNNILPLHPPHQCLGCGGPFDFLPSEQWPGDQMESGRMRRRDPNGERQPRSQKGCGLVHHSVWKIVFKITLYVRAYSKSLRHYYTSCFRILFYLL